MPLDATGGQDEDSDARRRNGRKLVVGHVLMVCDGCLFA